MGQHVPAKNSIAMQSIDLTTPRWYRTAPCEMGRNRYSPGLHPPCERKPPCKWKSRLSATSSLSCNQPIENGSGFGHQIGFYGSFSAASGFNGARVSSSIRAQSRLKSGILKNSRSEILCLVRRRRLRRPSTFPNSNDELAFIETGETTSRQSIIDNCRRCDVLIHEVNSQKGILSRPPEWQRYHSAS
jgi:hypothetical protein